MNFFAFKSAAERYAAGRPFFHPFIINRIKELPAFEKHIGRALDVGCGTGLSAIALKEIAGRVIGIDAAPSMLAQAPRDARIEYVLARAERLPFPGREFELLTLSQVCHWLDREKFFAEAHRVLRPDGWLVIYDAYFSAAEVDSSDFQTWHRESYLKKYPSPARSWFALSAQDAEAAGFQLHKTERLPYSISFTLEQLIDYLLTQSNIIAAVEDGAEEIDDVRRWLTESLKPFFAARDEASFPFSIPVWYLRAASI
jgi:ubiquinone/menaquinone biosynthesis C-methylase UbiE